MTSYRSSIVTFLYLNAFQRYCPFVLQHATFPYPPLVSPKFLDVPLDDPWATKSECVGLIVRTVSFQDFQPMWS